MTVQSIALKQSFDNCSSMITCLEPIEPPIGFIEPTDPPIGF